MVTPRAPLPPSVAPFLDRDPSRGGVTVSFASSVHSVVNVTCPYCDATSGLTEAEEDRYACGACFAPRAGGGDDE